MGLDVFGRIFVGIPVTRHDFFVTVGSGRRCPNGHPGSGAFCSQCGAPVSSVALEEKTPEYAALGRDLFDDDYIRGVGVILVRDVSAFVSGSHRAAALALCIRVSTTGSDRSHRPGETAWNTLEMVAASAADVSALARTLGIAGTPVVFNSVRLSY